MNSTRLRAAIVGLGQVGLMFDEEAERRASGEIWTHFSAYQALKAIYEVVALVDPDPAKRALAVARSPAAQIFSSVDEMLSAVDVDVVSVCTPDATHLEIVGKLLGKCRGIFLEKPLCSAGELSLAEAVLAECRATNTALRANYYKRAEPLVIQALADIGIAEARSVVVRYSGPFAAVGSHALNLMLAFAPTAELISSVHHCADEGDGYSGFFRFGEQGTAATLYCGSRNDLVFSCEINHSKGMVVIERNLSRLRSYHFRKSSRYAGYRELEFEGEAGDFPPARRFTGYLEELFAELGSGRRDYVNAAAALKTQELMAQIERLDEGGKF
jgi:predicted dehydrogenase